MSGDEQRGFAISVVVLLILLLLTGCGVTTNPPEPEIRTVEVRVPVPQPCPAIQELGDEPTFPDTDEALRTAPDLFTRVQLMAQGRLLRIARLAQYRAARASC